MLAADLDLPLPGLSASPRITRSLAFPLSDPPRSASLDGLRAVRLATSPPPDVLADPVLRRTLKEHSHLFRFDAASPYDIDALERLLTSGSTKYPDQALVVDFLNCMRHGFWPLHSGDFSSVTSFDYDKSEDDWRFIEEKGNEGFERGRLSEPFASPPPGTTFSPTFVRNPVEQKKRWVIDHTSSGLNSGIEPEDVRPVYDLLSDLVRQLRQVISTTPADRRDQIQIWRGDVKDAFIGVPVRPEWQARQLLRFKAKDGSFYFRVDYRLEFGNRASPYIWSVVEGFLLHIAKTSGGVPVPMAFVDDAFGADGSGKTTIVRHQRQLVRVPLELGGLLEAFNAVRAPWDPRKQLFGPSLRVLGIDVDAIAGTVSVPNSQKRRFALLSSEFVTGAKLSLATYRTWLGRAQFVGVACPWAKWRLNVLYARVAEWEKAKGRYPSAKRRVKEDEARIVDWYLQEVLDAEPLSIFDATLQRWPMAEADVILWTDSCGASSTGGGGLGFVVHVAAWGDGEDLGYVYRHDTPFPDNNLAETVAVASAFEHAIGLAPHARRICIFTDSTSAIYAADAGKGSQALLSVAANLFALSRSRRVDFRVRHVPGSRNTRADSLSRDPIPLLRSAWGNKLRLFSPSMQHIGGLSP